MASISDFLPDVMIMCPGVPDILAENKIRESAIEFCKLSGYWQEDLDPVTTKANQPTYDIETPADAVIRHLLTVKVDGSVIQPSKTVELDRRREGWRTNTNRPSRYVHKNMREITLTPVPDDAYTIDAYASLVPTNDATEIPDLLYDFQKEVIEAGAIFKLLMIPKKQWTDFGAGAAYRQQFYRGVKQARIDANKQYSNAPQFLSPKPFA